MNSSFAPFGPRTRNSEITNCPAAICAMPRTIVMRPAQITETRNALDMQYSPLKVGPRCYVWRPPPYHAFLNTVNEIKHEYFVVLSGPILCCEFRDTVVGSD